MRICLSVDGPAVGAPVYNVTMGRGRLLASITAGQNDHQLILDGGDSQSRDEPQCAPSMGVTFRASWKKMATTTTGAASTSKKHANPTHRDRDPRVLETDAASAVNNVDISSVEKWYMSPLTTWGPTVQRLAAHRRTGGIPVAGVYVPLKIGKRSTVTQGVTRTTDETQTPMTIRPVTDSTCKL